MWKMKIQIHMNISCIMYYAIEVIIILLNYAHINQLYTQIQYRTLQIWLFIKQKTFLYLSLIHLLMDDCLSEMMIITCIEQ